MRTTKIRVLLADDHVMVRDGLKRVINEQEDMEVVAEAADGFEALQLASLRSPDVALLDISMPGMDGVMVAKRMAVTSPSKVATSAQNPCAEMASRASAPYRMSTTPRAWRSANRAWSTRRS